MNASGYCHFIVPRTVNKQKSAKRGGRRTRQNGARERKTKGRAYYTNGGESRGIYRGGGGLRGENDESKPKRELVCFEANHVGLVAGRLPGTFLWHCCFCVDSLLSGRVFVCEDTRP